MALSKPPTDPVDTETDSGVSEETNPRCRDCPRCEGVMKYFLNGRFLRCPDCDFFVNLEIDYDGIEPYHTHLSKNIGRGFS